MLTHPAAIAAPVALISGWGIIHQARSMLFNGITAHEGGGWTALILAETMIFLIAVGIATA